MNQGHPEGALKKKPPHTPPRKGTPTRVGGPTPQQKEKGMN